MNPFISFSSSLVIMPVNDIDTDQIIPARFLKVTDKNGLGSALFADWRYLPDGSPVTDFILNQPMSMESHILLVGHNFGCGSSREHAPWALTGYGFRVVISTAFADIFHNNALKNGLLPVQVSQEEYQILLDTFTASPTRQLFVDLAAQKLTLPNKTAISFTIDLFSKNCLLNGVDELSYLLALDNEISAYERASTH
jgi:3-isopropylmalate/(R)-2-methylmalate dehydratase small subunit